MAEKLIIEPKKYTGDTAVLSVRLPSDMIKELDGVAEKAGRNRNEVISLCLEYALQNLDCRGNRT